MENCTNNFDLIIWMHDINTNQKLYFWIWKLRFFGILKSTSYSRDQKCISSYLEEKEIFLIMCGTDPVVGNSKSEKK